MLNINNLKASIGDKDILKGVSLSINKGEVHALMGPNGSGKSTLSYVLSGKDKYEVNEGTVDFKGKNLLNMNVEERANNGLFLAFQYPLEIPGVTNSDFLRLSYNNLRKHKGLEELDIIDFDDFIQEKLEIVEMNPSFLSRSVNEGFSGGEKKRNEILQMAILDPTLAILDETDSGLDIDALRIVAGGVNKLSTPHNSSLVITHYQRLLNYIIPDFIHVMENGKIILTGDKDLALELEEKGYDWLKEEEAVLA